jgi:hypothetical protein
MKAADARRVTVPLAASQLRSEAGPPHSQRRRAAALSHARRPAPARRSERP